MSDKFDVRLKWSAFQLDPTLPKTPVNKMAYYERKFGRVFDKPPPPLEQAGRRVGITFSMEGVTANTFDAHRLVVLVSRSPLSCEVTLGSLARRARPLSSTKHS